MDKCDDPYQILSFYKSDVTIDPSCIRKAYRELARMHHPDKNIHRKNISNNSDHIFAKISHAYEILKDEDTRKSYSLSQLHNDQKGYDPNGPTYYDSSSSSTTTPTATGATKQKTNKNKKYKNKMMNQPQPITRRTYYAAAPQQKKKQQQQGPKTYDNNYDSSNHNGNSSNDGSCICRTASATTNDPSTGEPKTFSYKKTSDGIITVNVTSPKTGTKFSSFSVGPTDDNQKVYWYILLAISITVAITITILDQG